MATEVQFEQGRRADANDAMPIHGIDHLELCVGAAAAYEHAVAHGARGLETPYGLHDEHGAVKLASVATYGETRHVFIERDGYKGPFLPGYARRDTATRSPNGLFAGIDHVVGNV